MTAWISKNAIKLRNPLPHLLNIPELIRVGKYPILGSSASSKMHLYLANYLTFRGFLSALFHTVVNSVLLFKVLSSWKINNGAVSAYLGS
jgi:hypothetical protein